MDSIGRIVAELQWAKHQAWESTLRLHVKPRPDWLPESIWRRLVNLVLIQSEIR